MSHFRGIGMVDADVLLMLPFLDGNTIWRRKFGEALRHRRPATVVCRPFSGRSPDIEPNEMPVQLPRGWASIWAWLAMPLLLLKLIRAGGMPATIVVTIPHYLPLARRAAKRAAIVYYCSDDYRTYSGWNATATARDEGALCRLAALSIFVSEALRTRAVNEYGLDVDRTFVSPNASEPRFAIPRTQRHEVAALAGPVFGAAGVINTRIDLALLVSIVDEARVGSLVLVGPIEADLDLSPEMIRLRANPNVHFFGAQPHVAMPEWMASFDVAVIPYAATELNRFCSPMRLYDHLAIGHPIVATRHCAQVASRSDVILVDRDTVADGVGRAIAALEMERFPKLESWRDRIDRVLEIPQADRLFPL